jgi:hypothetical protein
VDVGTTSSFDEGEPAATAAGSERRCFPFERAVLGFSCRMRHLQMVANPAIVRRIGANAIAYVAGRFTQYQYKDCRRVVAFAHPHAPAAIRRK